MATTSSNATPSSCQSTLSRLQGDLATFCRVRDRLVLVQDDAQLHIVLSKLIPRLLCRLDQVCKEISEAKCMEEDAAEFQEECNVRKEMKEELISIFTYIIDRIRDQSEMSCKTTIETVTVASIPWIPQVLPLCQTLETLFAQAMCLSLTRHGLGRFPKELAQEYATDLVSASVACLEQVETSTTLNVSQYRQSAWVLLYLILRLYGISIVPHKKLEYDEIDINIDSVKTVPWESLQATCVDMTMSSSPGPRFLELVLDVIFFSVAKSNRGEGMSQAGLYRLQNALHWSNTYQRQVQFCVVHSALHGGIYHREANVRLLIAILIHGKNSAHGQLATKYLDSIAVEQSDEFGRAVLKRKLSGKIEGTLAFACPLEVACTLLILVLGQAQAEAILQRGAKDCDHLHLLGPLPCTPELYRSPLSNVEHIVDILAKYVSIETESPAFNLYLELIDALKEHRQLRGAHWAMKLIEPFFAKLVEDQEHGNQLVYKHLAQTCLLKAWETLAVIPSADQRRENADDNFLEPRRQNAARRRGHANRLLERHRFWREQRALHLSEAEQGRETAYHFMTTLASRNVYVPVDPDGSLYIIPTQLFECTMNESHELSLHAGFALEAWCKHCQRHQAECWKRENSEQKQNRVARLLPCLLSAAVCTDSEVARMSVVTWCRDFVSFMDPLVALHLCSFLRDDPEASVARAAKEVVDDIIEEVNVRSAPLSKTKESSVAEFYSLSNPRDVFSLREHFDRTVSALAREAHCTDGVAFVLLQSYGFAREKVFEALLLDRSAALDQCGLTGRLKNAKKIRSIGGFTCEICMDDFEDVSEGYSLPCGHTFCTLSWKTYLSSAFESTVGNSKLQCPQHKCSECLIDEDVAKIVPELVDQFHTACLNRFIHFDKHFSQCPGTDCDVVAYRREIVPCETARCQSCHTTFCFDCMNVPHRPAKCSDHAEWKRQFGSNSFWMKKKSKQCPNCNVPIEKNEGCNHMKCTQCGTDFCWLCLSLMPGGSVHTCNRFESTDDNDHKSRVAFFTDRFDAHEEGELYTKGKLALLESKMESEGLSRMHYVSDEDWDALKEAIQITIQSRSFLKNSYVAVWALHADTERRTALENHQATLELVTERLSRLTNINLPRLYEEEDRIGIRNHFRSLEFHTLSVREYIQRVHDIANQ